MPADDLEATIASIHWALVDGSYDAARSQAWAAVERFDHARPELLALWYRGWSSDPDFLPPVETIEAGGTIDALEHLGGGSSITFRALREGRVVGAFKPNQSRLQTSYRGELAAYRLCALIHCGFVVPRNREVRIERAQVLALAGRTRSGDVSRFDRQYRDLVWVQDDDGQRWLYGTLKDWVPDYRQFAIELRDAWRPLVRLSGPPPDEVRLEPLMQRTLTPRRYGDPGPATALGRLDGEGLARQLSNLHVFDFLLNNWDRYSGRYWGVNCQWYRDRFVSIDNGAAFPPLDSHGVFSSRPLHNLQQVQRFSRRTIDAIRWMDPEAVYPILFPPSPDHDERADFDAFLARRQYLLDYVDGLVAEHGEQAVLAFR